MGTTSIKAFRDRFNIPIPDDKLEEVPFYKPAEDSPEMQVPARARAQALGGYLPQRRQQGRRRCAVPRAVGVRAVAQEPREEREISTTMAFVRILQRCSRDKDIGKHIVPIVPDEARTFGMEGMFRQLGIYSSVGQLYTPQDADQLMFYNEDKNGQILQEGINEAGAMCVVDRRGDVVQRRTACR